MNKKAINRALLISLIAVLSLTGCGRGGDAVSNDDSQRVESVRVIEIEYREVARRVNTTAHLQANRELHLAPAHPGRIAKIFVEAGQQIRQGQLLAEMDQTQLHQAELQLQSLETDFRRLDTLRQVGSVSQQQFDQIKTQYEVTKSNVAFLRENTRLSAPFSGKVSGKYFEDGEMFSGAPNTAAGKAALLSLVQLNVLKARVNIPERFFPNVKTGMDVRLSADTYPGEVFTGTVTLIYPVIDPITRSFTIEVSVPNAAERLRPGMFARASLDVDQVKALLAPSLAVMKVQGSNERYVFVERSGQAHRIVVEMGDRFNDMVELISDDIRQGDRLIVAGQSRLIEGVRVNVTD